MVWDHCASVLLPAEFAGIWYTHIPYNLCFGHSITLKGQGWMYEFYKRRNGGLTVGETSSGIYGTGIGGTGNGLQKQITVPKLLGYRIQ